MALRPQGGVNAGVSLVKSGLSEWSVSTTSPMPSFKDTLTPDELIDLVAYVSSLKGTSQ